MAVRYISISFAFMMASTSSILMACPAFGFEQYVLFSDLPKDVPRGLTAIRVHFVSGDRDMPRLSCRSDSKVKICPQPVGWARRGNSVSIWLPAVLYSSKSYFPVYYPVTSCTRQLLGNPRLNERVFLVGKFRTMSSGERYFDAASRSPSGFWQQPNYVH